MNTDRKRPRDSVESVDGYNPYCYDPQLPLLRGDPRLNPGLGLGVNWHPSQPVTNEWADWSGANRPIFDMGQAKVLTHARPPPPPPAPTAGPGPGMRPIAPSTATNVDENGPQRFKREAESHHQRRLWRNRHAAKLARRRKQQYFDSLNDQVRSLEASYAALKDHVWGARREGGRAAAAAAAGGARLHQAPLEGPRGQEVHRQLAHVLEVCTPSGATRLRGVAGDLLAADLAEPTSTLMRRYSHTMAAYAQAVAALRDNALENGLLLCCAVSPSRGDKAAEQEPEARDTRPSCILGARRRAVRRDASAVLALSDAQRKAVVGLQRALVDERAHMGDCLQELLRINAAAKPALGPFARARSALSSVLTSQQRGKLASLLLRDTPLSRALQQSSAAIRLQRPETVSSAPPPAPTEEKASLSGPASATTGPGVDTGATAGSAVPTDALVSRASSPSPRARAAASASGRASASAARGVPAVSQVAPTPQNTESWGTEALRAREAELEAQVQALLGELAHVRAVRYRSGTHLEAGGNPGLVVDELERAHAVAPSWSRPQAAQGPPPPADTTLGPWTPEMEELGVNLRELLSE